MSLSVNRTSYTGDPGIFGDIGRFIGGAVKSVPVIGGLVGGGIEMLANTLDPRRPTGVQNPTPLQIPKGVLGAPGSGIPLLPGQFYQQGQGTMPAVITKAPGIRGVAERWVPGGATGYQMQPGQGAPSGYHWNKKGYMTKAGWVEPYTKLVRNRKRYNPANAKATDRAISRIKSAKRYSKKLSGITIRETCKKR